MSWRNFTVAALCLSLSPLLTACNDDVETSAERLQKERDQHRERIQQLQEEIARKKKKLEQLKQSTPEDVKDAKRALRKSIDEAEQEIASARALLDQPGGSASAEGEQQGANQED